MPEQPEQPRKMPEEKPGQGGFRKNVPEQEEEQVERKGTDFNEEKERRGEIKSPSIQEPSRSAPSSQNPQRRT